MRIVEHRDPPVPCLTEAVWNDVKMCPGVSWSGRTLQLLRCAGCDKLPRADAQRMSGLF